MAKLRDCHCPHMPKKHKQTGRCRGKDNRPVTVGNIKAKRATSCNCNAAALKAERKRKERA